MRSGLKAAALEAESALMSMLRHLLYGLAGEWPREAQQGGLMVVAPHPDDETLGCGAAILRARDQGRPVRVVVVTDGQASHQSAQVTRDALVRLRQAETLTACERLGVDADQVVFLNYPDGDAWAHMESGVAALGDQIDDFAPGLILYPSAMDSHPDHRATAAMVERLISEHRAPCPAYAYPIWFWRSRTWLNLAPMIHGLSRMTILRLPTDGYIDKKRHALAAHRSQFENLTGEPGWEVLRPNFAKHFLGRFELMFETKVAPKAR